MGKAAQMTARIDAAGSHYRLNWLDYSRGLTTLLVIYAHVRNALIHNGILHNPEQLLYWGQVVTACTMPLFFFMSGIFVQSSARKPVTAFLDDKLRTLVYPYLLWSVLYFLFNSAIGNHSHHSHHLGDMGTIFYQPHEHLWFLYTLFCVMVLFTAAWKLGIRPGLFMLLACVGLATKYFGVDLGGGRVIEAVRDFLPYFAIGALVNRRGPAILLSEAPVSVLLGLVAGGYACSWLGVSAGWLDHPALRVLIVLPSAVALLSLAIVLERAGRLKLLEYLGQHSLQIYVAHVFGYVFMRVLLQSSLGVESLPVHAVLDSAAAVVVPLLMLKTAERVGFPWLFTLKGLDFGVVAGRLQVAARGARSQY